MDILKEIQRPVEDELLGYSEYFRNALKNRIKQVDAVNKYIIKQEGKQLRPTVLLLCNALYSKPQKQAIVSAAALEMLHNATLVHDDVVDETEERRGLLSINAIWNNKTAVLMGDYLLSNALYTAVDANSLDLYRILSDVGRKMSEGEIIQLDMTKTLSITEEIYYDIIYRKTAVLFASCTKAGALAAGASLDDQEKLWDFGRNLGMAFQIKDDVFDYFEKGILGKPTGNDLKENKLTLPLIHALSKIDASTKKKMLSNLKGKKRNGAIKDLILFTRDNGGIEYAQEKMEEFGQRALDILNEFDNCEAKDALIKTVEFCISRKK